MSAHGFELRFEFRDATSDAASIRLELRLTRPASADAASQPGHLDSAPGQPRRQVLQLGQLDLQAALPRPRMTREDVENQLRAVQHAPVKLFLKIALLSRGQFVIE